MINFNYFTQQRKLYVLMCKQEEEEEGQ